MLTLISINIFAFSDFLNQFKKSLLVSIYQLDLIGVC